MKGESKVMAKWQTVIPKDVREAANIKIGDRLRWKYESGTIVILPPRRVSNPSERLHGLIPSEEDAVREVKEVREKRVKKVQA